MIIEVLLNIVYKIFSTIIEPLDIEPFPADVTDAMYSVLEYMENASDLINILLPVNLGVFFILFALIYAFDHLYPLIMWVLRKIPFLGIE